MYCLRRSKLGKFWKFCPKEFSNCVKKNIVSVKTMTSK